MINPLFLSDTLSVAKAESAVTGPSGTVFFELLKESVSSQTFSEKDNKISISTEVARAAKVQKQVLVQDFLDYLLRHGLTAMDSHNEDGAGYLSEPFRVQGSTAAELKMDALLDQAAVMRQLFAVIAAQGEAAKARLEAHWQEEAETKPVHQRVQSQSDLWSQWLQEQALISKRSL